MQFLCWLLVHDLKDLLCPMFYVFYCNADENLTSYVWYLFVYTNLSPTWDKIQYAPSNRSCTRRLCVSSRYPCVLVSLCFVIQPCLAWCTCTGLSSTCSRLLNTWPSSEASRSWLGTACWLRKQWKGTESFSFTFSFQFDLLMRCPSIRPFIRREHITN